MSTKAVELKSTSTSPRRTRKKSALAQNNSAVSNISEAFKRQMATTNTEGKSKSKISSNRLSQKTKGNSEEMAKTKENIAKLINEIGNEKSIENEQNTEEIETNEHDNGESEPLKVKQNKQVMCEATAKTLKTSSNPQDIGVKDNGEVECENLAQQEMEMEQAECLNQSEDPLECGADVSNQEILEGLKEVCQLVKKLDNDIHHPKNGVGAKLVQLTLRLDNLYTDIHGAASGIKTKMASMEEKISANSTKIESMKGNQEKILQLMVDMRKLSQDIDVMKGLFQRHSQKLQGLEKVCLMSQSEVWNRIWFSMGLRRCLKRQAQKNVKKRWSTL